MSGYGKQKKGTSPILLNKGGRVGKQLGGAQVGGAQLGGAEGNTRPITGTQRFDQSRGYYQPDMGMGGGAMYNKGGRVGLKKGSEYPGEYPGKGGKKGIYQKVKEKISRKWRGKEKTEHKGLEQDVKTGAYTHKAPKDRMDTAPGRWWKAKIATGPHLRPGTKITPPPSSNDMSYKARKKEIAKDKKEADRKKAFDKKHGVK